MLQALQNTTFLLSKQKIFHNETQRFLKYINES